MLSENATQEKSTARCRVEAAAWRVHLAETGQASIPAFEAWLAADARHRASWEEVQRSWRRVDEVQARPELLELRSEVLGRVHAGVRQRLSPVRTRLLRRVSLSFGCAVVLVVGSLLWLWNRPEVYHTGPSERLSVVLADGSRVELDSSTDLRVRYSSNARELRLARGQARFLVAHDTQRPFSVTAASRRIVATGTDFDVDLLGGSLYVTLLEGRVLVLPNELSATHAAAGKLEAGEQLSVSASGETRIGPANAERVTAWQTQQIIFDDEPLAYAIERINRYSKDRLELADDAVAALRISGVFRTGNLAGFVETLTQYLPVDSERHRDVILLRTRQQPGARPAKGREQASLLHHEDETRTIVEYARQSSSRECSGHDVLCGRGEHRKFFSRRAAAQLLEGCRQPPDSPARSEHRVEAPDAHHA